MFPTVVSASKSGGAALSKDSPVFLLLETDCKQYDGGTAILVMGEHRQPASYDSRKKQPDLLSLCLCLAP